MCPMIPFIKEDGVGSLKRGMQTWVQVSEKFFSLYLSPRIMGDRSLLSLPSLQRPLLSCVSFVETASPLVLGPCHQKRHNSDVS